MLLASTQVHAPLPEEGVVPFRKSRDVVVDIRIASRLLNVRFLRSVDAKPDVGPDGVREEEHILGDIAYGSAQSFKVPLPEVNAVHEHLADGRVIEARDQLREGTLSTARPPNHGEGLTGFEGEIHPVERDDARVGISEADALEFDVSPDVAGVHGVFRAGDVRFHLEEGVDSRLARRRLLHQRGHPADRGKGPREQIHVEDELEDVAQLEVTGEDPESADVDGQDGAQTDQHDDDGHEERVDLDEVQRARLVQVGLIGEALFRAGLAPVGNEHTDAGIGLLHHGAEQTLLGLDRVAFLMDAGAHEVD